MADHDNPYGGNAEGNESDICMTGTNSIEDLMRRINALEAALGIETYKRKWGSKGTGDGQFYYPVVFAHDGIHVSGGEVFVTDASNHRVQVFKLDGTYKRKWGSYGTGKGQFYYPYGIHVSGGEVFVTDANNHRVQVFEIDNPGGTPFYAYASTGPVSLGTPDGGATVPANLAVESAGGDIDCNMILDCRAAIEAIVATGRTSFNWIASDPDNLYYVAMGDRTKYGATGGAKYTWTRTIGQMENSTVYDIDIGEIYECVLKLEDDVFGD